MNTITYETSYAPFLAIRVLKKLAVEEAEKILELVGVQLHKRKANDSSLLENVPSGNIDSYTFF